MNFFLTWKNGELELQAVGLGETVALFLIGALALVALALIYSKRSR